MAATTSGYGLLNGKTGVIFGALDDQSLATFIARAAYREGARFVLSNAPVTQRFGTLDAVAAEFGAQVVYADATNDDDLKGVFEAAQANFGKVDFVVHSIGMGMNMRKRRPYDDLNYEWFLKTLDISAISLHRVVKAGLDTGALADGGSVLALSYVGAQRTFSEYSEMGDAKALLESIVRSVGYRVASRGIRVNAVSQSPTRTTAGKGIKGFDAMFDYAERIAPLGNADAESCADYCVTLLSDLTRMVTMQTLYHDGGFSSMGISRGIVEVLNQAAGADGTEDDAA